MKKRLFILGTIAIAFAVGCVEPTPEQNLPEIEIQGLTSDTISVGQSGKTLQIAVVSNISWEAACDSSWVTVTPSGETIENYVSKTTPVKIKVAENPNSEVRTATVTVSAAGLDPFSFVISQSAKQIQRTMSVINAQGSPVEGETVDFKHHSIALVVDSENVDSVSVVSSDTTWLGWKASGAFVADDYYNITAEVLPNLDPQNDRSATLTFSAEGCEDVVVTITQTKGMTLSIAPDNIQYDQFDVNYAPSDSSVYYWFNYHDKHILDSLKGEGFGINDIVFSEINYYVGAFLENYPEDFKTAADVIDYLAAKGGYTETISGLEEQTAYNVYAQAFELSGTNLYFLSQPAEIEVTTVKDPAIKLEYSDYLGTYVMNGGTFTIEENEKGKSYKINGFLSNYGLASTLVAQYDGKFLNVWDQEIEGWTSSYGPVSPAYFGGCILNAGEVKPAYQYYTNFPDPSIAFTLKKQPDETFILSPGSIGGIPYIAYMPWGLLTGQYAGYRLTYRETELPMVVEAVQEATDDYSRWIGTYDVTCADTTRSFTIEELIPNKTLKLTWDSEADPATLQFDSETGNLKLEAEYLGKDEEGYSYYICGKDSNGYITFGDENYLLATFAYGNPCTVTGASYIEEEIPTSIVSFGEWEFPSDESDPYVYSVGVPAVTLPCTMSPSQAVPTAQASSMTFTKRISAEKASAVKNVKAAPANGVSKPETVTKANRHFIPKKKSVR